MAYIGNQPTSAPFITDTFSGDNTTTAFLNMTFAPAATSSIAVFVDGSYQTPSALDYTVSGTTLELQLRTCIRYK
jgi:archaellum component FlaG (FlaF/FlaG flagellin family)